jgi:hypothetical protein
MLSPEQMAPTETQPKPNGGGPVRCALPRKVQVGRQVRSDSEDFAVSGSISLRQSRAAAPTSSMDPTESQPLRPYFAGARRDRSCDHAGTDDERDDVIRFLSIVLIQVIAG